MTLAVPEFKLASRFVQDAEAQFLGLRRGLENAFLAKFAPAVDSVARKRGLLFVFDYD